MAEGEIFTEPSDVSRTEGEAAKDLIGILGLGGDDEDNAAPETETESDAETPAEDESEEAEDEESEEAEEESEESAEEQEDEEESDEEPKATAATDLHEVKVDGKVVKVTLDEMKSSFSFQKHLTQKSQKLAEKEKYLDGEYQAVSGERAKYADLIGQLEAALSSMSPEAPDWDKLRQENPLEFSIKWAEHEQQRERLAGLKAEREHVTRLQQEHLSRERAKTVKAEQDKLRASVPGWNDDKVLKQELGATIEYAKSAYGYSDEDLLDVTDSRAIVILDKARRYDELKKAKPKAIARAAEVVKTSKPGSATLVSKTSSSVKRLQQRATRTGDVEDVASLILARGLLK